MIIGIASTPRIGRREPSNSNSLGPEGNTVPPYLNPSWPDFDPKNLNNGAQHSHGPLNKPTHPASWEGVDGTGTGANTVPLDWFFLHNKAPNGKDYWDFLSGPDGPARLDPDRVRLDPYRADPSLWNSNRKWPDPDERQMSGSKALGAPPSGKGAAHHQRVKYR